MSESIRDQAMRFGLAGSAVNEHGLDVIASTLHARSQGVDLDYPSNVEIDSALRQHHLHAALSKRCQSLWDIENGHAYSELFASLLTIAYRIVVFVAACLVIRSHVVAYFGG